MRYPGWKLSAIGTLLIGSVGVGLLARTERRSASEAEQHIAALVDSVAQAKGIAHAWQRQYARLAALRAVAADGVTVTRVVYRTVRDSLPVHPVTPADTARAIALLPDVVRACDSLAAAATEFVRASAESEAAADSTIAAKDAVIATLDTLVRVQGAQLDRWRRGPRLSAVGQALYDPFAGAYAAAVQGGVRVVGDWSVIGRAEQRLEPHGARAYVGLSHPLF